MAGGISSPFDGRAKRAPVDQTPDVRAAVGQGSPTRNLGVHGKSRNQLSTPIQEDDLDKAWQDWAEKRDPNTTRQLLTASQPVITKAVATYAPNSSPAVRSQAKILVRKAMDTFDPTRGTKFRTYLYTQLQPLRREAGSYETLHVPERVRMDLGALNTKQNQFVEEHGKEPSDQELADFSGLSMDRIRHIRRYDRRQLAEGVTRPRSEKDIRGLPEVQQRADIWELFVYDGLSEKDKLIYDLKTGKGNTQKALSVTEISVKMKMSPSAVSQRLQKIADEIARGPNE